MISMHGFAPGRIGPKVDFFERVGRRTLESNASTHLVIDMRHIISAFIKNLSTVASQMGLATLS